MAFTSSMCSQNADLLLAYPFQALGLEDHGKSLAAEVVYGFLHLFTFKLNVQVSIPRDSPTLQSENPFPQVWGSCPTHTPALMFKLTPHNKKNWV